LKAFIEEDLHVYHDEMVDFIGEEFDVDVSLATISPTLAAEKISRKKVGILTIFLCIPVSSYSTNFSYKE